MKNAALLMKLDMILRGKSAWRMKWQFLFFVSIFGVTILLALQQPPKLFLVSYFNEDSSYGSRLAVDNFIRALDGIAEIKEVREIPKYLIGDAFVLFPDGFAEKWQHFEKFPAKISILTQNPVYQVLLAESFQAYENILLASESVILAYNKELDELQLAADAWTGANVEISLEFLAMAFQRNQFFKVQTMEDLPAALTKTYYFFSFSLFLGIMFSIYWCSAEIEWSRRLRRLFLSHIRVKDYLWASKIGLIYFCFLFTAVVWGSGRMLKIEVDSLFAFRFFSLLLLLNGILRLLTFFFRNAADYTVSIAAFVFISALLGGGFLPISFLPANWIRWTIYSPFYQMLHFLVKTIPNGSNWVDPIICCILTTLILSMDQWYIRRKICIK